MSPSTQEYLRCLVELFQENRNDDDAKKMKKYMRDRYAFLGIKAPKRAILLKEFLSQDIIPKEEELKKLLLAMWENPYREIQYAAMEILEKRIRKVDLPFVGLMESLVLKKSWWDTVDWLATRIGLILLRYPDAIENYANKWIESDNIWWQRLAIIFQLKYKSKTAEALLFHNILRRRASKEFFIQKASGWALREYSKTAPEKVLSFIEKHALASLTEKEGLKWMKKKGIIR